MEARDLGKADSPIAQTFYEAVASEVDEGLSPNTVLLVQPSKPYACIGFHQEFETEIDVDYCRKKGLPVIRRSQGGGATYLNSDQVFYQVVAQRANDVIPENVEELFKALLAVTVCVFEWSEQLNLLHNQASDLAVEIIARYQPVASDLRYIKSCFEISYGFSRLGRYAFDVSQIINAFGSLSGCDTSEIREVGDMVKKMIRQSIDAYFDKDTSAAEALKGMDDQVDARYMDHIKRIASTERDDLKCAVALTLAMKYMERMGDHAGYIGDSVIYVATCHLNAC